MTLAASGYWCFQANPQRYDIERAIVELEFDVWTTKRHEVRAGDFAIIWKSLGGSSERGVLGFAEVLDDPDPGIPDDSPYWRSGYGPTNEPKVHIRYVVAPNCPVWVTPITAPILSQLSVYRSQGSIFHVTPEQWEAVVELAGGWPDSFSPTLDDIEQIMATKPLLDPSSLDDARVRALRQIVLRRGQPAFRQILLEAYGGICAMTGCSVSDVLEAAHIRPYRGPETNHVTNGLLLRADIHTLFDLGKITVDEESLEIRVDPTLMGTDYQDLGGNRLKLPSDPLLRPSATALRDHRLGSQLRER